VRSHPQAAQFFHGGLMNSSTYDLVKQSLAGLNRLSLLNRTTRLYCHDCQEMRRVTEFYSLSKTAVLDCKHRRPAAMRTDAEITAFKQETEERARKRLILEKRGTQVFEETLEQAA
jgi:hypothetical protein